MSKSGSGCVTAAIAAAERLSPEFVESIEIAMRNAADPEHGTAYAAARVNEVSLLLAQTEGSLGYLGDSIEHKQAEVLHLRQLLTADRKKQVDARREAKAKEADRARAETLKAQQEREESLGKLGAVELMQRLLGLKHPSPETRLKDAQRILNKWAKQFGMANPPKLLFFTAAHIQASKERNNGGVSSGQYSAANHEILVHRTGKDANLANWMTIIAHEFGHAIVMEHIAKELGVSPAEVSALGTADLLAKFDLLGKTNPLLAEVAEEYRQFIRDSVDNFALTLDRDTKTLASAEDVLNSNSRNIDVQLQLSAATATRQLVFGRANASGQMHQRSSTFQEWLADHLARSIEATPETNSAIKEFFAELAETLKAFYELAFAQVGGKRVLPAPTVKAWADSMRQSVIDLVAAQEAEKAANALTPVTEIPKAESATAEDIPNPAYGRPIITEPINPIINTALQRRKRIRSRISGHASPIRAVWEILADSKAFHEVAGGHARELTQEIQEALHTLFMGVAVPTYNHMERRAQELIQEKKLRFEEGKILSNKGTDLTHVAGFRALQIMRMENGVPIYDTSTLQTAILAGLTYALGQLADPVEYDNAAVLSLFPSASDSHAYSLDTAGKVLSEHGRSSHIVVQGIAEVITRYLDFAVDPDGFTQDTRGIIEGVAKELLSSLTYHEKYNPSGCLQHTEAGWDKGNTRVVFNGPHDSSAAQNPVSFFRVRQVTGDTPFASVTTHSKELADLLERAISVVPEKQRYVGTVPTTAQTVMHSPALPNTPEALKAIEAANNQEYFLEPHIANVLLHMGEEGMIQFWGEPLAEDPKSHMNTQHRISAEGVNQGLRLAYRELLATVKEANAFAGANNLAVSEVPIRFGHNMSVVSRLQQLGTSTPQGSKHTRSVISPVWATLDASTENEANRGLRLGLAQALGFSVHTKGVEASLNWLAQQSTKMEGSLLPALQAWLQTADTKEFDEETTGTFPIEAVLSELKVLGLPTTPDALTAVVTLARLFSGENLEKFKTATYVEHDGATNGVANAQFLVAFGELTENDLLTMARVGVSFGEKGKSLAELRKEDPRDVYTVGAHNAVKWLRSVPRIIQTIEKAHARGVNRGAAIQAQRDVLFLFSLFFEGEWLDADGNITLSRKSGKGPTTIMNYGAGAPKVSENLVAAFLDEVYAGLTRVAQNAQTHPEEGFSMTAFLGRKADVAVEKFSEVFTRVTGDSFALYKAGPSWKLEQASGTGVDMSAASPEAFVLAGEQARSLTNNVHSFVGQFVARGVKNALPRSMQEGMTLLQQATNGLSVIASIAFRSAVERQLVVNQAAGISKNRFLTEKQLKDAQAAATQFSVFQYRGQNFPMHTEGARGIHTVARSTDSQGRPIVLGELSRDTHDHFRGAPPYHAPGELGVGGTPRVIIGLGDAAMMQGLVPESPNSLPVFDGMNSPVDSLKESAARANAAVLETWEANIFWPLAQQYELVLDKLDITGLPDRAQADILEALRGVTPIDMYEALVAAAIGVDARHATYADFKMWADQMATMETPVANKGTEPLPEDMKARLEIMEARRREHVKRLWEEFTAKDEAKRAAIQARAEKAEKASKVLPDEDDSLDGDSESIHDDYVAYSGPDDRLTRVMAHFVTYHKTLLDGARTPLVQAKIALEASKASQEAILLAQEATYAFNLTSQEEVAFSTIVAALSTGISLDAGVNTRLQELFLHAQSTLSPHALRDPNELGQAVQEARADVAYSLVFGSLGNVQINGRPTQAAIFLALAMVSGDFRNALASLSVPKKEQKAYDSFDNIVTNLYAAAMNVLTRSVSHEGKQTNTQDALDALSLQLEHLAQHQQSLVEELWGRGQDVIDAHDAKMTSLMERASLQAERLTDTLKQRQQSPAVEAAQRVLQAAEIAFSDEKTKSAVEVVTHQLNSSNTPQAFRRLWVDLTGRTASNGDVFDAIKKVRHFVQGTRQTFRDGIPKVLRKAFKTAPTALQASAMYHTLGKLDIAALGNLKYFQEGARNTAVAQLEHYFQQKYGKQWQRIHQSAQQLAKFMVTGEPGHNLAVNAWQLVNMYQMTRDVSELAAVDKLVSLYALTLAPKNEMETMQELLENEPEGVKQVLDTLIQLSSRDRITSFPNKPSWKEMQRLNTPKGTLPRMNRTEGEACYVSVVEVDEYVARGYEHVKDQSKAGQELVILRATPKAMFNQGILQYVRSTYFGAVPSMDMPGMNTALTSEQVAKYYKNPNKNQGMLPTRDSGGRIVALTPQVSPEVSAMFRPETDLLRLLGVWAGRQIEERLAPQVNEHLAEIVGKMWLTAKGTPRAAEFININLPESALKKEHSPTIADAAALIPPELRKTLIGQMGGKGKPDDPIMIRRDMLEDIIGVRTPSVSDLWTENTNLPANVTAVSRKAVEQILGPKARVWLTQTEKFVMNRVQDAKVIITIKSGIVPVANVLSNVRWLLSVGVRAPFLLRTIPRAVKELDYYNRTRAELVELTAGQWTTLAPEKRAKQQAQVDAIKASWKRLHIYPLIEAGEVSAIAEDLTETDVAGLPVISQFEGILQKMTDAAPGPLKTAAKTAFITQDTAIFRGLSALNSYGDFVAKAVLYAHLTEVKNGDSKEALQRVSQEFVHYDLYAGRERQYLEKIGLMWFWNYKLRAMGAAVRAIKHNPLQVLLVNQLPWDNSIGTPIEDGVAGKLLSGTAGRSLGPGMGLRAWNLHPLSSIF